MSAGVEGKGKRKMNWTNVLLPITNIYMRIIAFIEDYKITRKILDYLGIYELERERPPHRVLAIVDNFND